MARPFDFDWLTPALAVGGRFDLEHVAPLAADHGIGHVVDLRLEACDDETTLVAHGIELLHLPTEDVCAIDDAVLREGVAWVIARMEGGGRVLVHCEHGIGRSALLALCVLVARGDSPIDALRRAKRARAVIAPSPEQLAAFSRFCAQWREDYATSWEIPRFSQLAAIAYGR